MVRGKYSFRKTEYSSNIDIMGAAFSVLLVLAFFVNVVSKILGSLDAYRFLMTAAMIGLVLGKRFLSISTKPTIISTWIPMLIIILVNVVFRFFSVSILMDLYTFFVGVVFVWCAGDDSNVFRKMYKLIETLSIFFAISVWIQLLVPRLYNVYLRLIPEQNASKIQGFKDKNGLLTGFSTSPGFTAGYVAIGILALVAVRMASGKKSEMSEKVKMLFLLCTALLIGKRGHLLALVFAILLCYLIENKGKKRLLIINVLMIGFICLIPIWFVFSDFIMNIPALARIANTLVSIGKGEDFTSGRGKLYLYAWEQFKNNPAFGIGWGCFRLSIVGVVTAITELDVHNIYLQLLCETGVVGFAAMLIPMIAFLHRSIKDINILNKQNTIDERVKSYAVFSLMYQLFFMVYGISGNPLYDYCYLIVYFISCAITQVIHRELKKGSFV